MEGIIWIAFVAYNIIGCFYYCFSIRRIVSFIKKMKADASIAGYIEGGITVSILLMTLIVAWPYYVWLDFKFLED